MWVVARELDRPSAPERIASVVARPMVWLSGIARPLVVGLSASSNLLLRRLGARVWISRIMISWGLVSMLTAAVS
jgi:hypothetical protein